MTARRTLAVRFGEDGRYLLDDTHGDQIRRLSAPVTHPLTLDTLRGLP